MKKILNNLLKRVAGVATFLCVLLITTLFLNVANAQCPTYISEDFENGDPYAGIWSYKPSSEPFSLEQLGSDAHSGSNVIVLEASSAPYTTYSIISPQFNSVVNPKLKFYIGAIEWYGEENWYTSCRIKISDNGAPFTTVYEYSTYNHGSFSSPYQVLSDSDIEIISDYDYWVPGAGSWYLCDIDLSSYDGHNIQIEIEVYDHYGCSYFCIDDITLETIKNNDIEVLAITAPISGIGLGANENVTVKIKNNGTDPITEFDLELWLDGVQIGSSENFNISSSPLLSGASDYFTFLVNKVDLSAGGTFEIKVIANLIGDENICNNEKQVSVVNSCVAAIVVPPDYTQGFENSSIPNCWAQEYVTGSNSWIFSNASYSYPSTSHSGAYRAQLSNSSSTADVTKLIMPVLDLSSAAGYTLTFWHAQTAWSSDQDQLRVYYKTSSGGTWNLLQTYTTSITSWTERIIPLPNTTSTYYIAFEGTAKYGHGVVLDDIKIRAKSSDKDILTFSIPQQTTNATIVGNPTSGTVNIQVLYSADLQHLTPTITVSNLATISPNSLVEQNFTSPFNYTVTAEDGTTKTWTVNVTKAPVSSLANITSFTINGIAGIIDNISSPPTVTVTLPWTTVGTTFNPIVAVSPGANLTVPSSLTNVNFASSPVSFTVKAEDLTLNTYDVTVIINPQPILNVPFAETFEGTPLFPDYGFTFQNNGVNTWFVGSATNNTPSGTKALYISNNGGVTNAYENSISRSTAYIGISFGNYDEYTISFDYKSTGESSSTNYDVMRAYLIPNTMPIPTNFDSNNSNYPSGSGVVQVMGPGNNGQFSGSITTWQHYKYTFPNTVISDLKNQTKKLVFFWYNDGSIASVGNVAAAVDNIELTGTNCLPPTAVNGGSITFNSAIISWTPPVNLPDDYEYAYSATNAAPSSGTIITNSATTSQQINGLDDNKTYYVWVRSVCSGEYSNWSVVYSFKTLCLPESVPFTENFDGYQTGAANCDMYCWYRYYNNGTTTVTNDYPYVSTSYYHSGTKSLSLYKYSNSSSYSLIITPEFATPLNTLATDFWVRSNTTGTNKLEIFAIVDPSNPTTYNTIKSITLPSNTTWEKYSVSLVNAPAGTKYVGYKYSNTSSSSSSIYIDDLEIRLASSAKEILTFTIPEEMANATITDNTTYGTVDIDVLSSADLQHLTPTITVSNLATISPNSLVEQNFTSPFNYIVTAENGTTKTWTVNVTNAPVSSIANITSFIINGIAGIIDDISSPPTVTVTLPWTTVGTTFNPIVAVSQGAEITVPSSLTNVNFASSPVSFTVKAEDGTLNIYDVTVIIAPMPVINIPFAINFETPNAIDSIAIFNSGKGSSTITPSNDKFVIGNATGNPGKSLYVSPNGGTTNAYTEDYAFATAEIIVNFSNYAEYNLSFDWKCVGEGTSTPYDYGRVYIVDLSTNISSYNLPSNNLDGINFLAKNTWQSFSKILSGPSYSGIKKLVFAWRTDSGSTYTDPLAIDNIRITGTNCLPPTAVNGGSITFNSAIISWTAPVNLPDDYEYAYSTTNTTPSSGTIITNSGTTSQQLSGLNGNQTYYVWVRSICSGEYSNWSVVYSFKTLCAPEPYTWTETFSTSTFPPSDCWMRRVETVSAFPYTLTTTNNSSSWNYNNDVNGPVPANGRARINVFSSTTGAWLITPNVNLGTSDYNLSFDLALTDYYSPSSPVATSCIGFKFMTLISLDGGITWNPLKIWADNNYKNISNAYTKQQIDLSAYSGIVRFAFYACGTSNGDNYIHIDNIGLNDCTKAFNINTQNLASDETDLTWEGVSNGGYSIEVYSSSQISPTFGGGDVSSNTETAKTTNISGLTANTTYYVYIQSICNGSWSQEFTFQTPDECSKPTVLQANFVTPNVEISWDGHFMTNWNIVTSLTPLSSIDLASATPNPVSGTELYNYPNYTAGQTVYYYVQADCGSSITSAWANNSFMFNYCVPAPTSHDGSGITNVTFGQNQVVNNSSSHATSAPWYKDNSALIGDVYPDFPLDVSISMNTGSGHSYNTVIWVDLNNNLIFDASEILFVGQCGAMSVSNSSIIANITIPTSTPAGSYKMRIGTADLGLDNPPYNPCYTSTYAAFEDYTINVLPEPDCSYPTNVHATTIDANNINVTWDLPSVIPSEGYEIFYNTTNTAPTSSDNGQFVNNGNTISEIISGLDANTTYYFWVRSVCEEITDSYSPWYLGGQAKTLCEPESIPFTENFDSYQTGAANCDMYCWYRYYNNGTTTVTNDYPYVSTDYYHSGTESLRLYKYSNSSSYSLIISPEITDDLNTLATDFWVRSNSSSTNKLEIFAIVDPSNPTTYNLIKSITLPSNTTWTKYSVSLAAAPAGTKYVGYKYSNTSSSSYSIYMDDLEIRLASTANDILTFSLPSQTGTATPDPLTHTVDIEVAYGIDLSNSTTYPQIPTITISPYATILPTSATQMVFDNINSGTGTAYYNVTAENGVIEQWTVYVHVAQNPSTANEILTFSINGINGQIDYPNPGEILVELPWIIGTNPVDIQHLTPTITISPYATISPLSAVEQNFTNPITYTVTSQSGSANPYVVTVTIASQPILNVPFTETFENTPLFPDYGFNFQNNGVNTWFVGSATNNTPSGTKALYISNNSGVSNAYNNSISSSTAYVGINFGNYYEYTISFDYKSTGESSNPNYDVMRAYLIPNTMPIPTNFDSNNSTYPSGSGVVQVMGPGNNGQFSGSITTWQHYTYTFPNTVINDLNNQTKKLVFFWYNDSYGASVGNVAAAVDNIEIIGNNCVEPTNLTYNNLTQNEAFIAWTQLGPIDHWNVKVFKTTDPTLINVETATVDSEYPNTNENPLNITGLDANEDYFVYVQGICTSGTTAWVGPLTFTTPSNCPKPTNVTAVYNNPDVVISWDGLGMSEWNYILSTTPIDPTITPFDATVYSNEYIIQNYVVATNYYFYVQSTDNTTCFSDWSVGLPINLNYCTPTGFGQSVDGQGITNVSFGTPQVTNPHSYSSGGPFYNNFTNIIGSVYPNLPTTVNITYKTGYTYGTVIWVDWNDNLVFEQSELVYTGESLSSNPTTLAATFVVPSTATAGHHRMRIGGADSYYDSNPNPNPCLAGNFTIIEDYTLNVLSAPEITAITTTIDNLYTICDGVNPNSVLPQTVDITTTIGAYTNVPITWAIQGYTGIEGAGDYPAIGTPTLAAGIVQPSVNPILATTTLHVNAKPSFTIVDYNSTMELCQWEQIHVQLTGTAPYTIDGTVNVQLPDSPMQSDLPLYPIILTNYTSNNEIITLYEPGYYEFHFTTLTDATSCSANVTAINDFNITVKPSPAQPIVATNQAPNCASVQLPESGDINIIWTWYNALNQPVQNNLATTDGTYFVHATFVNNNCSWAPILTAPYPSTIVNVWEEPSVEFDLVGTYLEQNNMFMMCSSNQIDMTFDGGTGPYYLTGTVDIDGGLQGTDFTTAGITVDEVTGKISFTEEGIYTFHFTELENDHCSVIINENFTVNVSLSGGTIIYPNVTNACGSYQLPIIAGFTWELNSTPISNGMALIGTNTYQITVTNNACEYYAEITVTVNPLPTVSINFGGITPTYPNGVETYSLCMGPGQVMLDVTGAYPIDLYIITGDEGINYPMTIPNSSYIPYDMSPTDPTMGTQYHYLLEKIVDNNGCQATATILGTPNDFDVIVNHIPEPTISNLDSCGSVILPAGDFINMLYYSYVWTGPYTSPVTTLGQHAYTVVATNSSGCSSDPKNISVTVKKTPTISITFDAIPDMTTGTPTYTLCMGDPVDLDVTGDGILTLTGLQTNDQGLLDYINYLGGGFVEGQYNMTPTNILTGVQPFSYYFDAITSDNGCSSETMINGYNEFDVYVNYTPLPTLIPITECGSYILPTSPEPGVITYNWTLGSNPTPLLLAEELGLNTYDLLVTNGNCSETATLDVTINALPTIAISFGNATSNNATPPTYTMCMGNLVDLTVSGEGPITLYMNPATTDQNLVTSLPQAGTFPYGPTINLGQTFYYLLDSIEDGNGCKSYTTLPGTPQEFTVVVNQNPVAPQIQAPAPECGSVQLPISIIPEIINIWLDDNGNVVPNSIATESGDYSIVVSEFGCFSDTVTIFVTVYPIPQAPTLTTNADAICQGDNYDLITNVYDGTWTLINPQENPHAVTAAGPYTVVFTDGNNCTSLPATFTLTVNSIPTTPTLLQQSDAVCANALPYNLNIINNTGTWLSNGTPVANNSALTAGTYDVIAIVGNCSSDTAHFTLTVNQNPAAPNLGTNTSDEICANLLPYDLTAIFNGTWTLINSEETPDAVTVGGNYSVITTDGNGCNSTATTFTLTVKPLPIVEIQRENNNNVLIATTGFDTYKWYLGSNIIEDSIFNTLTINEIGVYIVVVIGQNACEASDTLEVLSIGIKDVRTESITVYPNPSNGEFTINLGNIENARKYQIFDMKGSIVTEAKITSSLQQVNINVVPGNYTVKVITDRKVYVENIVIR